MAGFYPIPPVIEPKLLVQLSSDYKAKGIHSDWRGGSGAVPDVFLEGPTTTADGTLYFVDIPFGRILKVDPETMEVKECVQWDGEPNGLAVRVSPSPRTLVSSSADKLHCFCNPGRRQDDRR